MAEKFLIDALQNPALFPHPVTAFQVIETHISWVLLTGSIAYKIKKPVNLGFVDYSTKEKRHFFCQEELRLNQHLAKELYLEVIPIYGTLEHPSLNADNSPSSTTENIVIEFAVKMHQFDNALLLSNLLKRNVLNRNNFREVAQKIAQFHKLAHSDTELNNTHGALSQIKQAMLDNFQVCEKLLQDRALTTDTHSTLNLEISQWLATLAEIKAWSNTELEQNSALINTRKTQGFIRHCHGDLHLENMVFFDKNFIIFDCVEFNVDFYMIDTMNEIAFLCMDLEVREHPNDCYYFLNQYLQIGGDFTGLKLLNFYKVYRAMVRAKVALQTQNAHTDFLFKQYLDYAKNKVRKEQVATLWITFGVSGSGKTHLASELAAEFQLIHLRSDIERKRLFQPSKFSDLYSSEKTKDTYQRLWDLAHLLLSSGQSVIVDASFLKQTEREHFHQLAQQLNIPFLVIACNAPREILEKRIQHRLESENDASDATLEVLNHQLNHYDVLTTQELTFSVMISTEDSLDIPTLTKSNVFRQ